MVQRVLEKMDGLYDEVMELVTQVQRIPALEERIDTLEEDVLDLTAEVGIWETAARRLKEAYTASDPKALDDAIQGILSLIR